MGYMWALRRFDEAVGGASIYPTADLLRDRLLVALIEALTWLDMLFDHEETEALIDARL